MNPFTRDRQTGLEQPGSIGSMAERMLSTPDVVCEPGRRFSKSSKTIPLRSTVKMCEGSGFLESERLLDPNGPRLLGGVLVTD